VECKSCESDRRKLKIIFVLPSSASLSPTAALQSKCGTSSIERPLGKKGSYTQKKGSYFPKKIFKKKQTLLYTNISNYNLYCWLK